MPLLHLPVRFPSPTSGHLLTTWTTITLNLPSLLPHFSSASLIQDEDNHNEDADEDDRGGSDDGDGRRDGSNDVLDAGGRNIRYSKSKSAGAPLVPPRRIPVPSGTYSHVSYVKVYATCRLRRILFTEVGSGPGQNLPWEFQLYGSKA